MNLTATKSYLNRGIKHDFLFINIHLVLYGVLKEPEVLNIPEVRPRFSTQHSMRDFMNVNELQNYF